MTLLYLSCTDIEEVIYFSQYLNFKMSQFDVKDTVTLCLVCQTTLNCSQQTCFTKLIRNVGADRITGR